MLISLINAIVSEEDQVVEIELKKFNKLHHEISSTLDRWTTFFYDSASA
nr:Rpn family recombination-promoting nuclease/putative transposase [Pelodictyon phaeoclathratiforme]